MHRLARALQRARDEVTNTEEEISALQSKLATLRSTVEESQRKLDEDEAALRSLVRKNAGGAIDIKPVFQDSPLADVASSDQFGRAHLTDAATPNSVTR